jgi:hypothetical protein
LEPLAIPSHRAREEAAREGHFPRVNRIRTEPDRMNFRRLRSEGGVGNGQPPFATGNL